MDHQSTSHTINGNSSSNSSLARDIEEDLVRQYERVGQWCRHHIRNGSPFLFDGALFEQTLKAASQEFGFPLPSLHSFFRNLHTNGHVKSASFRVRNNLASTHLPDYRRGHKTIKEMARESNFPPALMSRAIAENVADLGGRGRKALTNAMRDPRGELGDLDVIRPEYLETEVRYQQERQRRMQKRQDGPPETTSGEARYVPPADNWLSQSQWRRQCLR